MHTWMKLLLYYACMRTRTPALFKHLCPPLFWPVWSLVHLGTLGHIASGPIACCIHITDPGDSNEKSIAGD